MVKNVIKNCCPVPSLSSWFKGLFLCLLVSLLPLYFLRNSLPHTYVSKIPDHVLVFNGGNVYCSFMVNILGLSSMYMPSTGLFLDMGTCAPLPAVSSLSSWVLLYPSRHVTTYQPPWVFSEHLDGLFDARVGVGVDVPLMTLWFFLCRFPFCLLWSLLPLLNPWEPSGKS